MHPFEVTILGCNSAIPTSSRYPTAQVVNQHDRYFLVDCGEAAQMQLRRFKFKIQRIDHILISHLHGDHYLGLPGLLGTMHLLGREKELHIYSHVGLEEIIKVSHHYSKTFLRFPVIFHTLEEGSSGVIYEDEQLTISTIPMNHRIACSGFLFREKKYLRNIIKEKIEEYQIPLQEIPGIKEGNDLKLASGKIVPNAELTTDPPAARAYAYCSDTIYNENYIEQVKGSDLMYHEATFAEDMKARTVETYHCTATQAGTIAQKAQVKRLMIGHYSARYHDLSPLLSEAKAVFPNTVLAEEGQTYQV